MRTFLMFFALSGLLIGSPAAGAWSEIRSPHFLFLGDARPAEMRRIAQRFEQFHTVIQQLLARAVISASAPTVILVLKDRGSLKPFLPLHNGKPVDLGGLAIMSADLNYIALDAARGADAFPVVFHELAHVLTNNIWRNPASWYAEGVAECYSTFEMRSATDARIGIPVDRHVALLREGMMPLREFLAITDVTPLIDEGRRANLFYAQSWALVHFLVNRDTGGKALVHYRRLSEQGVGQAEALTTAFGVSLATLERDLHRYVNQVSMTATQWTLPQPVTTASLTPVAVEESAVAPRLADLQFRLQRYDEAEKRVNDVIAAAPRSASAHAMLASIRLHQNRSADAGTILAKDLMYRDFFDHYTVASVLNRYLDTLGAERSDAADAQKLFRDHIVAAIAIRTDVAEAWRLAARAHLLVGDVEQASNAIARAIDLAPASESARFGLVNILVRTRDFVRSREILGELMARGRTRVVRTEARQMMGEVVRYEQELAKATSTPLAVPTSSAAAVSTNVLSTPAAPETTPIFRTVAPGETRVFGILTAIECHSAGVTLVVAAGARQLRVNMPRFDQIEFVTYRDDLQGRVSCGQRTTGDAIYVTWRGQDTGSTEISAASAVVEFAPLGYKP